MAGCDELYDLFIKALQLAEQHSAVLFFCFFLSDAAVVG